MPLRYRLSFLEAVFVRYLNINSISHHKCNNLVILSWANETLDDAYSFLLTTTQKNRVIFNYKY